MAQVFPKNSIALSSNYPEVRMVEALQKQLDSDVAIYHGLHMMRWDMPKEHWKTSHLRSHETDIVIVDPRRGILLIEVKGASVEFDATTGNWGYRNPDGFKPCKHPFGQACSNLTTLTTKLLQGPFKGKFALPFPYGFAIAFPTKKIDPPFPLWYDNAFVFTAADLANLGNRVEECLSAWNDRKYPKGMPEESLGLIDEMLRLEPTQQQISPASQGPLASFLLGEIHLTEAKFWDIEQSHKRIEELTEDQAVILDILSDSKRLGIRGPAGSGKTMLAFIQAKRYHDAGKKVLLLCYNAMLADDLKERVSSLENVEASGVYELVNRFAKEAGLPSILEGDTGYWEELPGIQLEKALFQLELAGKKPWYDAIIVDEGQDFCSKWWPILEELIRPDSQGEKPLVIFHDPLQNLFRKDEVKMGTHNLPDNLVPGKLTHNCRNTKKIAAFLSQLVKEEIPTHRLAEEGMDPVIIRLKAKSAGLNDDAAKQIEEWINHGFEFKDMAILKPFRYDQEKRIIKRRNGQGIPLVKTL